MSRCIFICVADDLDVEPSLHVDPYADLDLDVDVDVDVDAILVWVLM